MSRRRRGALLVCVLVVLGFYLRCAWSYGKRLDPAPSIGDFQNLQADAFLAGQLNLTIPVPEGLALLPDPFDPVANQPYRTGGLHDLTFYKGKLYTYFGPAPVVLLYVPFRLLRVGELSPTLAVLIFASGGFLASVGVFRILARRFLSPLSVYAEAMAVVALGFAAPLGWLIHIGRGYEVSIACGYFLTFSGLFFLCRGLFDAGGGRLHLAAGSLLLAGAEAARPNMFWLAGFLVFALAYLARAEGGRLRRSTIAVLLGPYVTVALTLAWYNWARFDSVLEFGTNYMMLGENIRLARADEIEFLRRGLFEYLLSPARTREAFPWLALRPLSFPLPTELNYLKEPVAGLLPNMPACLLGIGAFCLQPISAIRRLSWFSLLIGVLAGTGLAIVSLNSFHFHSTTMRYQIDYAPLLLLASVLGWSAVAQRMARTAPLYRVLQGAAVLVVAWSAFFSVAITTYPCAGTGSC